MFARSCLRSGTILKNVVRQSTRRTTSTNTGNAAKNDRGLNIAGTLSTVAAVGSIGLYYQQYGFGFSEVHAMTMAEEGLHPAHYPWEHQGWLKTFDHQALRRGFQVYREVCASCHSLSRVPWRALVGVSHTVDEVKAMAEESEYDDEPNDVGEIEKRPGKLSDYIPDPYPNEQAARAANQGAYPPDLVLYDGLVEYEDGTPATTSQMAKDVVEFLNWAAEPEMDQRKKMGMKVIIITTVLTALSIWVKKYKWAPIKARKLVYNPPKA
ncbi:hypothetical protein C7212DRAFT_354799 [Tuber magnatum]|uniref:quinol--cytochrome-c reductase n=1 Tax=Tuber magnatum TaxID=42249 RepID=A0A317SC81_9PEZI|nr:hypothetical protein C7212DRAFT_354799 [Tuber magnatum]